MAPKAILYRPYAQEHNSYACVHTHTSIKIWRVSGNFRGWFICVYGMDYGDDFKNIKSLKMGIKSAPFSKPL